MKPKKEPRREAKDGEVEKLRKRIKRLERERNQWKAKCIEAEKTFQDYVRITSEEIGDLLRDIDVREIIEAVKDKKKLRQVVRDHEVRETCKKCFSVNITVSKGAYGTMKNCKDCNYVAVEKNGNTEQDTSQE